MWRCHQVDHLPESEFEIHLTEKYEAPKVAPSLGCSRHTEKKYKVVSSELVHSVQTGVSKLHFYYSADKITRAPKTRVPKNFILYSGDLNNGLVQYSNGENQSDR